MYSQATVNHTKLTYKITVNNTVKAVVNLTVKTTKLHCKAIVNYILLEYCQFYCKTTVNCNWNHAVKLLSKSYCKATMCCKNTVNLTSQT